MVHFLVLLQERARGITFYFFPKKRSSQRIILTIATKQQPDSNSANANSCIRDSIIREFAAQVKNGKTITITEC